MERVTPSRKLDDLRGAIAPVCTALAGESMFARAEELSKEFAFFEFRLDTLADPAQGVLELGRLLEAHPEMLAIATCRRESNGGHFSGSAMQEVQLLQSAAEAEARVVDLSLESAEELQQTDSPALHALRSSPAALLVSWHDFRGTPDLETVHRRIGAVEPDIYKIVPTAERLCDSFALLDLLERHRPEGNLIAMSMGVPGLLTRVLGPRSGSLFTFGSSDENAGTAPGQVTSRILRDLYRLEQIGPQTAVYGVFGKPVGGSKSPVMLNTAFREAGLDAVYLPLETDSVDELFACVSRLQLAGVSVTMPLKERIVPKLAHMSELARQLRAANTLMRSQDGTADDVLGDNTDVAGILRPLQKRLTLEGARCLVLGAGGAARAAVYALASKGAQVSVSNRTHTRAEELAEETGATALRREQLAREHFQVILNATPYGMAGQDIAAPITETEMHCDIFFDMVYNPLETPLVQIARAKGIAVIPGIEMFVTQGAAQFELWCGQPAPVDAMREAVLQSLTKT